jgi:branched-subunit amino acid transport protein
MTWLTMVLVGVGSYAFRAVPLLVLPRVELSDRADRMLRNAGAAALTALLVTAVTGSAERGTVVPTLAALALAAALAARGASLLRIVLAGGALYAMLSMVWTAAW